MAPRFVVITGGPGSGKTSVVDHLASLGYATVPEAAIQIIDEINQDRGISGQIAWRKAHQDEFQRLIFRRQVALEAACEVAGEVFVFCDRGRPDVLAYAELAGLVLDDDQSRLIEDRRYYRVFLLDTLTRFEARPDTGRTSDRQRSLRLRGLLKAAYRSLGYEPVPVPELPIGERAQLILSSLGHACQSLTPQPEPGKQSR